MSPAPPSPDAAEIHALIDSRHVRSVFQPLVDLGSGDLVAFEALSRGPQGTVLERPDLMLEAARKVGRLDELDQVCRSVAVETAIGTSPWPTGLALFINAEPTAMSLGSLDVLNAARNHGVRVTVELTERDVAHDLATLLVAAERIRAQGGRVALDDVGAEPASLALIPLLRPDVVKLDMGLLRNYAAGPVAATANAVRAYAEESGASVVAEGIETDADLQTALVLGATIGQGWLFGRPGPLEVGDRAVRPLPAPLPAMTSPGKRTPFDVVSSVRPSLLSTKELLLPISHTLEQRGLNMDIPPMLLSAFQHARHFTPATAHRYEELAAHLPFVAALGVGMTSAPARGVRGAALIDTDPLIGEWSVVVLGAHFAAALVAQDLNDDGAEQDRRFRYAVTHDRSLVVAAARTLIDRVVPV
jgi:EAL domain-containing protein (putative c-di-GMP-specific phosphodiesterase class I)